ncbi:MAG: fatty acyl-AMP ligase, partial [Bacteroidota bacterium]
MTNNNASIAGILRQRAIQTPDQQAFVFLNNRGTEVATHTYGSLDEKVRKMAAVIRSETREKDRVLLLFPPGLEFIEAYFACMYANVIAVPAYPPRKNAHAMRIHAIVRNAGAALALTTANEKSKLERNQADFPFLQDIPCMAIETDELSEDHLPTEEVLDLTNALSFLQYTSGSTGDPKGVMVAQDNLIFNLQALQTHTQFNQGCSMVSWLPAFHDMGLIYGILLPIFVGNPCYMMAPVTFIANPLLWLRTIANRRATHAVAPNFAFDLCYKKISPEQLADLDFSQLRYFANAAEPIREESIQNFASIFPQGNDIASIVSPAYGLAEATLVVSCSGAGEALHSCSVDLNALKDNRVEEVDKDSENAFRLVGSGGIINDTLVRIVRPETGRVCKDGEVGEIWVQGQTVTKGYWQNEAKTEEIFHAYTSDTEEGPFLRTGDLGFVKQNQLYITGRHKDLIIIEGANYYPQDIEYTAQ